MYELFIFFALGYILGSIPSAAIVARVSGKDIFTTGSGNMGAMNSLRNVGVVPGLIVFALDIGKGALATFLALWLTSLAFGAASIAAGLAALVGAVLGHAYSAFVQFRGGKALAVTFGALLPLFPLLAMYALLLLVALLLITRKVEFSSIVAVVLLPVLAWFTLQRMMVHQDVLFAGTTAVAVLVPIIVSRYWLAHRGKRNETPS